MGFGVQKGTTSNQASTAVNYGSDVWGQQAPFLQDLYAKAQGMSGMANQGQGAMNQAQQSLMQMIQGPGATDPTLQAYGNQLGRQFREQIMPGMRGDAMAAGAYGGSRAGIGQGLAAGRAQQQLQDFGAQTYADRMNRQLGASQGLLEVGQAQAQAPWSSMQQYAGLLGPAVNLSKGGYQTSSGGSIGGGGFNMRLW